MKKIILFFIVQFAIIFAVGFVANWILDVTQNLLKLALIAFAAAIPTTFAFQKMKLLNCRKS